MFFWILFLQIFGIFGGAFAIRWSLCRTCSFQLGKNQYEPIVLKNNDILIPNEKNGMVHLHHGEMIQILCSGEKNSFQVPGTNRRLESMICQDGNLRDRETVNKYHFENFRCRKTPQSQIRDNRKCNRFSKQLQIGFEISNQHFLPKIEVCFNENTLTTYWTKHELKPSNYSYTRKDIVTNFKKDFFDDNSVNPDEIYNRASPKFDRGHLTPKGDFSTKAEKLMTFYYINIAPQAPNFNRRNWKYLELGIRKAARKSQDNFFVYTGTAHPVYYMSPKNAIPVSRYFWKVIIASSSRKGVAFVGVNDDDVKHSYQNSCSEESVCSQLTGLTINSNILRIFQISCCTIEAFRRIENVEIPQFPEYGNGLLTNF